MQILLATSTLVHLTDGQEGNCLRLSVLGLQAAIADGSEPTFDGQPMQAGTHLRWAFTPELGFPPGAFWLTRRVAGRHEKGLIEPPVAVGEAIAAQESQTKAAPAPVKDEGLGGLVTVGSTGPPAPCECCDCCCRSDRKSPGDEGAVDSAVLAAPREGCGCCCCCRDRGGKEGEERGHGTKGGGTGTGGVGGLGWRPTGPKWGPPDERGWQAWGEPFTLPVTQKAWPARYFGALNPLTEPEGILLARDVLECKERLGSLDLLAGMSTPEMRSHFTALREECVRLVKDWPVVPNYAVGLAESEDGPSAPRLSLRVVSQLQLAALSPYMARVLGLYFVDTEADPHTSYDYCLIGVWQSHVPPLVRSPGGAPAGALARGRALYEGMRILAEPPLPPSPADPPEPPLSHLYAWQSEGGASIPPQTLPGTPPSVMAALAQAVEGLPPIERPPALLAAQMSASAPLASQTTVCEINLNEPVAEVAVSVAGTGSVSALCEGATVASVNVSGNTLSWHALASPDPTNQPIDAILVIATGAPDTEGVMVVGSVVSSPVLGAKVGVRYAEVHAPKKMQAPPAPAQPVTWFRRRTAEIEAPGPALVARSFFEVQWAAPPPGAQLGDPVQDPEALPPPTGTVAYLAQRRVGEAAQAQALGRIIAAASQAPQEGSPLEGLAAILRFVDAGLPDPPQGSGYQHRTAGFGLFGQLGAYSEWSEQRGVEYIAAAPTLRLRTLGEAQTLFDNSPAGGGAPDAADDAWVGGTLKALVSWSGSALLAYPDARSACLSVLDETSTVLASWEFELPVPQPLAFTLLTLVPDPTHGVTYAITEPPLPALASGEPPASLTLTGVLADGTPVSERFAVRPGVLAQTPPAWPAAVPAGEVVATLLGGEGSRVASNRSLFEGRPAYLLEGVSVAAHELDVPLRVPVGKRSARGEAVVAVSPLPLATGTGKFQAQAIVEPNTGASRAQPSSNAVAFTAAQQLKPPAPPQAEVPVPTHIVEHLYYSPADYEGNASYTLPFDLSQGPPAVSGYVLRRAPAHSLFIADVRRRRGAGLLDQNPRVSEGGQERVDLKKWIEALPAWLAAYNNRLQAAYERYLATTKQSPPEKPPTALTEASVLEDAAGQRELIEHFYGGLLDDELRALADLAATTAPEPARAGNEAAFAQVDAKPIAPSASPLSDTVPNGNGFGRNLYQLCSINGAGSRSAPTPSVGPIYTRTVRPSRAPVLYKVAPQPGTGAFIVAWALDASPDVAGYLVYRAPSPEELVDVRWWGSDPERPLEPVELARVQTSPGAWSPLSLTAGERDPRLIGLVNDPRAWARDYQGSDMGEVALPPGTPPEEILGVYRLAEFEAKTPAVQPGAFNYWIPGPAGGTAQLVTDTATSPASARITGLRLGLGRGVAVVVVARYAGAVRTIGVQEPLRAAFVDGPRAPGETEPADANALLPWTPLTSGESPAYAVVAVDVAGNRSAPSRPFTVPALVTT